jgi:hypothetical protein
LVFRHLKGLQKGLADADSRWDYIKVRDSHGFRGMTTHGFLKLKTIANNGKDGVGTADATRHRSSTLAIDLSIASPFVCFESAPPENHGRVLHSAVAIGSTEYVLPPLTLLEVVRVVPAGQFPLLDPATGGYVDPGTTVGRSSKVSQRLQVQHLNQIHTLTELTCICHFVLGPNHKAQRSFTGGLTIDAEVIVVRPTFLLPANKPQQLPGAVSRFASDRTFLQYGGGEDAVRGLDEVIADPPLTMEQEFERDDTWTDWKGNSYSAWDEYQVS